MTSHEPSIAQILIARAIVHVIVCVRVGAMYSVCASERWGVFADVRKKVKFG
jgi:hypothetical protein